jgi:hypothetical protein
MRLMYFTVFLSAVSFLPFNANHLAAECAKCTKIEAERKEEKEKTPQPTSEYYEDLLNNK